MAVIARSKHFGCDRVDRNGDDKRQQGGLGWRVYEEICANRDANNQRGKHGR